MSSVLNTKLSFACNCTTIQHGPTISEDGLTVRVQQTIKLFHVVIPSPSAGSAPSLNSPLRPLVHPTKNPLSSLLFNERSPHPLQVHPTKGETNRLSLTTSIYTSNTRWPSSMTFLIWPLFHCYCRASWWLYCLFWLLFFPLDPSPLILLDVCGAVSVTRCITWLVCVMWGVTLPPATNGQAGIEGSKEDVKCEILKVMMYVKSSLLETALERVLLLEKILNYVNMDVLTLMNHHGYGLSLTKSIQRLNY